MKVEFQIKGHPVAFRQDFISIPRIGEHVVLGNNKDCEVTGVTYDMTQAHSIAVISLKLMGEPKIKKIKS